MATQYDPSIIQAFADRLYDQARSIVITYGFAGLFFGAIAGAFAGYSIARDAVAIVAGICALLGLLFGVSAGRARAFVLKLQAQQALCQVQIEQNTGGTKVAQRAA